MKNIIIVIVLVVLSTTIFATEGKESPKAENTSTFSISGTVVDAGTGEALVGVAVKIGSKTAYTDFEGQFKLANISENQTAIETSYVAYEDKKLELNPKNASEIKIALKEK